MRYGGFLLLVLAIFTVARFWLWIAVAAGVVVLLVVLWKFASALDRWLIRQEQFHDRGIYGKYRPHEDFSPVGTDRRAERM